MNKPQNSFSVGDKVFAMTNREAYWPAKISKIEFGNKTRYNVLFYGKKSSAVCNEAWLKKWNADSESIYTKKFPAFKAALEEMKNDPGSDNNKENEPEATSDQCKSPHKNQAEQEDEKRKRSVFADISNKVQKQQKKKIDFPKAPSATEESKVKNYISDVLLKIEVKNIKITKLLHLAKLGSKFNVESFDRKMKELENIYSSMEMMLKEAVPPELETQGRVRRMNAKPEAQSDLVEQAKAKELYKTLNPEEVFIVQKSSIHGNGAFAKRDIGKGEWIADYGGEVIDKYEADAREQNYKSKGIENTYMFELPTGFVVDATVYGNDSKFINHSCNPNAEVHPDHIDGQQRLSYFTNRLIKKGEEITIDYMFAEEKIPCKCAAKNCRQYLN